MGITSTRREIVKLYDKYDKEERKMNLKMHQAQVKLNKYLPEHKKVIVKDNINQPDPPDRNQEEENSKIIINIID